MRLDPRGLGGPDVFQRVIEEADRSGRTVQGGPHESENLRIRLGHPQQMRGEDVVDVAEHALQASPVQAVGVAEVGQPMAGTQAGQQSDRPRIGPLGPAGEGGQEHLGLDGQRPLLREPPAELRRLDLAALEPLHRLGVQPAIIQVRLGDRLAQQARQFLEQGVFDQDAAQIEHQRLTPH